MHVSFLPSVSQSETNYLRRRIRGKISFFVLASDFYLHQSSGRHLLKFSILFSISCFSITRSFFSSIEMPVDNLVSVEEVSFEETLFFLHQKLKHRECAIVLDSSRFYKDSFFSVTGSSVSSIKVFFEIIPLFEEEFVETHYILNLELDS